MGNKRTLGQLRKVGSRRRVIDQTVRSAENRMTIEKQARVLMGQQKEELARELAACHVVIKELKVGNSIYATEVLKLRAEVKWVSRSWYLKIWHIITRKKMDEVATDEGKK